MYNITRHVANNGMNHRNSLWHAHLADPSDEVLKNVYSTLQLASSAMNKCNCEACPLTKSRKLPFKHSHEPSSKPFECVAREACDRPVNLISSDIHDTSIAN